MKKRSDAAWVASATPRCTVIVLFFALFLGIAARARLARTCGIYRTMACFVHKPVKFNCCSVELNQGG